MNYVMIQHSDDGGHTWSGEVWKKLVSEDKNYLNRVRLHNQGSSFNRIYRLAFTGDASFTIISGHARIGFGV